MKNILVIHYSQTGQLTDILKRIIEPFKNAEVEEVLIKPTIAFPFPWSGKAFFDAMPETVLEDAIPIDELRFNRDTYDLVIFGYQPWFLSPSLPASALLQNNKFLEVVKGTKVITVIGARNMWLNAQESVKNRLKIAGAILIGNIPLIDRNNNLVSALTIMHWMFGGKKTKKWGFLPKPGILEEDIASANEFGLLINAGLEENNLDQLQGNLLKTGRISIKTNILFIEQRAKKIFLIWARLIKSKGTTPEKRSFWVSFFKYYLIFALFVVSPVILLIFNVLVKPFVSGSLRRKKDYFCSVKLNIANA